MDAKNDIFSEHADDEVGGQRIMSFKDELRQMPGLVKFTIYMCLFCFVMLCLQCIFILPVIITKYGWGYGGAYLQ